MAEPVRGAFPSILVWVGAVLLGVSSYVHFHLWDIAYRHVATLGPLFLLQGVMSAVAAAAVAITHRRWLVLGSIALMAGTMVGFALVLTTGLFGFKLHEVSSWAYLALACEGGAVVIFSLALWLGRGGDGDRRPVSVGESQQVH